MLLNDEIPIVYTQIENEQCGSRFSLLSDIILLLFTRSTKKGKNRRKNPGNSSPSSSWQKYHLTK